MGVQTREQLDRIAATVTLPLVLGNVPAEMEDPDYLATRRVRICLQGHLPFAAAVQAVYHTLPGLRDGMPPKQISGAASGELMRQVTRDGDYQRWPGSSWADRYPREKPWSG